MFCNFVASHTLNKSISIHYCTCLVWIWTWSTVWNFIIYCQYQPYQIVSLCHHSVLLRKVALWANHCVDGHPYPTKPRSWLKKFSIGLYNLFFVVCLVMWFGIRFWTSCGCSWMYQKCSFQLTNHLHAGKEVFFTLVLCQTHVVPSIIFRYICG